MLNKLVRKIITYLSNRYCKNVLVSNCRASRTTYISRGKDMFGWLDVEEIFNKYGNTKMIKEDIKKYQSIKHKIKKRINDDKESKKLLLESIKNTSLFFLDYPDVTTILELSVKSIVDNLDDKIDINEKELLKQYENLKMLNHLKIIAGKLGHFRQILIDNGINTNKVKVFGPWMNYPFNTLTYSKYKCDCEITELNLYIEYARIVFEKHPDTE